MKRGESLLLSALLFALILPACNTESATKEEAAEKPAVLIPEPPAVNVKYDTKPYNPHMEEVSAFAQTASSNNRMEILMADIAMERSENAEIDQLAQTIRTDLQAANDNLHKIVNTEYGGVIDTLMTEQQAKLEMLRTSNAKSVDQEFLQTVIVTHKAAIADYERCAVQGYDTQIDSWIRKTVPVLQKHVDQSEQMLNEIAAAR